MEKLCSRTLFRKIERQLWSAKSKREKDRILFCLSLAVGASDNNRRLFGDMGREKNHRAL